MKLLIAEDDKTSRIILQSVCAKWGYEVITVEDGQAAWQLMQDNDAPQLMLIDWEMPRMSGIEFCQRVREKFQNNPPYIILLTSRTATQDIVAGLKNGANDYIAKPFDNDELQVRLSVGKRVLQLQNELHKTNNALNIERGIMENILLAMKAGAPFDSAFIRYIQAPVEKTSGDLLLAASCPDGRQHVLLGDFTGHGITAALGGPIASDTFYKMTAKGFTMADIGNEINQHMCNKMPTGLFLAAILLEVNPQRNSIQIWNCGMEDILFFRNGHFSESIKSSRPALGIIKDQLDNMVVISFQANDKLYAYSDGIIETTNSNNKMFGQTRLITSISEMLSNNKNIQALQDYTDTFRGGTSMANNAAR
ncbi:MAG: SpoIIE family protein phosphatase [Colwellia sp.]|nr:SpoIIE family protein phosphatase [Colwellia sp.]